MAKKIAEITLHMVCGGHIKTYIKCKDERDLLKKIRKKYKDGYDDFGHFKVELGGVLSFSYRMHEVN